MKSFLFFWFKNAHTPLSLSRDKTKGQSSKNITLTPTKILPKKYDHSSVEFQIALFTYKLDSQNKNKNYIYIIKIQFLLFFIFATKKPHCMRGVCVRRLNNRITLL